MKHVQQRRLGGDCGVACVAMLAGVSYSEAYGAFIDSPEGGTTYRMIRTALRHLRVELAEPRRVHIPGETATEWHPESMRWWLYKRAIVAVWLDLKSTPGFLEPHWVAIDAGYVHDGRMPKSYARRGHWPHKLYPTSYMEVP